MVIIGAAFKGFPDPHKASMEVVAFLDDSGQPIPILNIEPGSQFIKNPQQVFP